MNKTDKNQMESTSLGILSGLEEIETIENNLVTQININKIDIEKNVREHYSNIEELKENIKIYGVQSPIKIQKKQNGRYKIIFGHRRFLANKLCFEENGNKFAYIPAIEEKNTLNTVEIIELQLIENIDRENLSDFEKGKALKEYKSLTNKSNKNVADRFGKKEKWTRDIISAFEIIENAKKNPIVAGDDFNFENIKTSLITELKNIDAESQIKILQEILKNNLNRNEVREMKKSLHNLPNQEETKEIQSKPSSNIKISIDVKKYFLEKKKLQKVDMLLNYIEKNIDDKEIVDIFKIFLNKINQN